MKKVSFLHQFTVIFRQGIRAEISAPERWLSPLLFATTILLLFSFAFGKLEPSFIPKFFMAETFLTAFFALQICFSRTLEPDTQDRVFELMRAYPVRPMAWFLAKYAVVVIMGAAIVIPTLFLSEFFLAEAKTAFVNSSVIIITLLALLGLGSLGVLLSTMMMKSGAKQILYPLLYFPLTTPVLLAAVESTRSVLTDGGTLLSLMNSWMGLLIIFNCIYITLGILLFEELVHAE